MMSATTGSFVISLRGIFRFLRLVINCLIFSVISLSLLLLIFSLYLGVRVSLPETSNLPPRAIKVDDWILPAKPSLSVTWSL